MARMKSANLLLPAFGLMMMLSGAVLWGTGASLDLIVFDAMRRQATDAFVPLIVFLTTLGGLAVLGPLSLAVACWLYLSERSAAALWLLVTVASGRLMVEAMKLLFERARPPLPDRLTLVTSHSFPSGHSAGTMVTCLALAMLFRARHGTLLPLAFLAACAIGWSRVALGVHWPSDVISGWGFGMLWVGIARRFYRDGNRT